MPKTRAENKPCWKLSESGMLPAENMCATCCSIKKDDLSEYEEKQDMRVCEVLGVSQAERRPRKVLKAARGEGGGHDRDDRFPRAL